MQRGRLALFGTQRLAHSGTQRLAHSGTRAARPLKYNTKKEVWIFQTSFLFVRGQPLTLSNY